jgi:hypothetical protein
MSVMMVLTTVLVSLAPSQAKALPLYASREGKTCVTCHYDPNGGGMRNDFGFLYEKNRHGLDTEEKWGKVTVDPRLNEWVAIGVDVRLLYVASHTSGVSGIAGSTFVPMQGQLNVAVTPTDYLSVVMSRGISTDPDAYVVREVYGLIHDLPHALYAKVGRFRLPFGLRQDDHTSFIRQEFLPYNSQFDDAGVEVGAAGARTFGQVSFTNGQDVDEAHAETFAAKTGVASRRVSAGISGYHQYQDVSRDKHSRWALYATSTWRKLTFLGEAGAGTTDRPAFGGVRNLRAAFAELDYRLARGLNVRGKFDYLDPTSRFSGDLSRRYSAEADIAPVPFTELKLAVRHFDEEGLTNHQEFLAQFFFPF